jgi:hypothetical protein
MTGCEETRGAQDLARGAGLGGGGELGLAEERSLSSLAGGWLIVESDLAGASVFDSKCRPRPAIPRPASLNRER